MNSNQELADLLGLSKITDNNNMLNISQQEVNLEFNRNYEDLILPPINQDPRIRHSETEYKNEESIDESIKNKNKSERIKKTKTKDDKIKNDIKKPTLQPEEKKYLDIIANLKKQIETEKNKYLEEFEKLNTELLNKEKDIQLIIENNNTLQNNLTDLSSQVKQTMIKKGIPIEKEVDEPIKIALKVKDKEIRNTQTLVKALSNENKEMRKILDKYTDSNTKRELSDKLIDIEREYNKLKNEVKTLKLLNKPHETCPKEKENLEKTLKNLENELQNCKNRVLEEQLEYKKLEKKYYSKGKDMEELKKKEKKTQQDDNSRYEINREERMQKIRDQAITKITSSGYKLLSDEEKETLKRFYDEENENQFDILMKKIDELEKYRLNIDTESFQKIKKQQNELNELNEQLKYMDLLNNDKETQIRYLEAQINEFKNNKKALQQKINSITKDLEFSKAKERQKDKENDILIQQVSTLKQSIRDNMYGMKEEQEINKVIGEIKHGDNPIDMERSEHGEEEEEEESYEEENESESDN